MIEAVSIDAWLTFDAQHPAPTFFARPAWALALAHAFPNLRPAPLRVRTERGSLLVPLMQSSGGRFGWKEYVGMPLGAYTCALRADGSPASAEEFASALSELSANCDAIAVTPWPLQRWELPSAWTSTTHRTAVIDLGEGLEQAMHGVDGVTRRMAGQAQRRGVACRPCRSGLGSSTYYGMLREASEGWGLARPPFPRELLEGLVAYGGSDVDIWLAECDNHAIAGGVVLYGSQEMFFWSAAMRQAYARMRPSNALNFALMEAAAERGVRWYNLGASEGLPGVERFKRGLGAQTITYAQMRRQRGAFAVYSRLRTSFRRPSAAVTGRV